ncbi:MAG: hypothetical protein ACI9KE_005987 [Polyangiales bacterium]|jgi:hypothetical protein
MFIRFGLILLVAACTESIAPDPIGRFCIYDGSCDGPGRYVCVEQMCAFDPRPFDAGSPDGGADVSDSGPRVDAE